MKRRSIFKAFAWLGSHSAENPVSARKGTLSMPIGIETAGEAFYPVVKGFFT